MCIYSILNHMHRLPLLLSIRKSSIVKIPSIKYEQTLSATTETSDIVYFHPLPVVTFSFVCYVVVNSLKTDVSTSKAIKRSDRNSLDAVICLFCYLLVRKRSSSFDRESATMRAIHGSRELLARMILPSKSQSLPST